MLRQLCVAAGLVLHLTNVNPGDMAVSINLGSPAFRVLITKALLFGVQIKAPDFENSHMEICPNCSYQHGGNGKREPLCRSHVRAISIWFAKLARPDTELYSSILPS